MSLLLIDDQGEIWDGQSRRLRQSFDSPYSGGEFSDYAVTNLGFVALNVYGASCQIRLRPSIVGDATHRSLAEWLRRSTSERVVLTWLSEEWSNELLRGPQATLQRLDQLAQSNLASRPSDFLSRRLAASELPDGSTLRTLLQDWPRLLAQSGQQELMWLIERLLGERYLVVKPDADQGRLNFHSFGAGLFHQYDTWRACAVGAPMEEMPDRAYGQSVAPGYYATLEEGLPRVEDVDAIVRWPEAGRARLRYKRVIVPLRSGSRSTLLVGGSILDNRIDLRVGLV